MTIQALIWDEHPGVDAVTLQIDDGEPFAAPALNASVLTWTLPTADLEDGLHALTIVAQDGAWIPNTAQKKLVFQTDNTFPALSIASGSMVAQQGRTLAIWIRAAEPLTSLTGALFGKTRAFYEIVPGMWRALVGVAIRQEAGVLALALQATDQAGNQARAELPIDVSPGNFPRGGMIRLTPAQEAARKDDRNRAKTRKERDDVYRHRSAVQRWSAPMMRPVSGRRTSAFGRYRTYSDGRRSYHSGTDLANVTGTPVMASAAGEVHQAGWEHIFGNVVIVDHGQGVSTSYNHLSAVSVTVGQQVERGDKLGEVGSTGQSTGPHLHWGLVIDGVAVDAEEWLDRTFDADEYPAFVDISQIEGGAIWSANE